MFRVEVKLRGKVERLRSIVSGADVRSFMRIFNAWATIFNAFILRRFLSASRSDGTWKELAPRTLRRKKALSQNLDILRATDTLLSDLNFSFAGVIDYEGTGGFEATIRFDGRARYENGMTTEQVLEYHQTGGPNLPQREVVVEPDAHTRNRMAEAARNILRDELNS